jgi:hypothetical protein
LIKLKHSRRLWPREFQRAPRWGVQWGTLISYDTMSFSFAIESSCLVNPFNDVLYSDVLCRKISPPGFHCQGRSNVWSSLYGLLHLSTHRIAVYVREDLTDFPQCSWTSRYRANICLCKNCKHFWWAFMFYIGNAHLAPCNASHPVSLRSLSALKLLGEGHYWIWAILGFA